jgi:hypothetical protein
LYLEFSFGTRVVMDVYLVSVIQKKNSGIFFSIVIFL